MDVCADVACADVAGGWPSAGVHISAEIQISVFSPGGAGEAGETAPLSCEGTHTHAHSHTHTPVRISSLYSLLIFSSSHFLFLSLSTFSRALSLFFPLPALPSLRGRSKTSVGFITSSKEPSPQTLLPPPPHLSLLLPLLLPLLPSLNSCKVSFGCHFHWLSSISG